jgi:O-antigen/teichoic acid export membrane protein
MDSPGYSMPTQPAGAPLAPPLGPQDGPPVVAPDVVAPDEQGAELGGEELHQSRRTRKRLYFRAVFTGAGARFVSNIVNLSVVALTVRYLQAERYGLWIAISTAVGYIGLANFGLGLGLLTKLSGAHGRGDRDEADEAVWSTLAIVTVVALVLSALVALIGPLVPWQRVFNVSSAQAIAEARPTSMITAYLVILMLPLGLSTSIMQGHQRTDLMNVYNIIAYSLGLAVLYVQTRLHASLPALVVGLMFPQLFYCALVWVGAAKLGLVRWRPSAAKLQQAWKMLFVGGQFFLVQILFVAVFQTDAIIIAQRFGAKENTPYGTTWKMVMMIVGVFNLFISPLWPAYGEALAKGDRDWVRRIFKKNIQLVFALWLPAAIGMTLLGKPFIRIWAGPEAVPSTLMLLSMVVFTLSFALSTVANYLLNGAGALSSQIIMTSIMAVVHIPLAWWLCGKLADPAGVVISQTALLFILLLPATYIHAYRLINAPITPAKI